MRFVSVTFSCSHGVKFLLSYHWIFWVLIFVSLMKHFTFPIITVQFNLILSYNSLRVRRRKFPFKDWPVTESPKSQCTHPIFHNKSCLQNQRCKWVFQDSSFLSLMSSKSKFISAYVQNKFGRWSTREAVPYRENCVAYVSHLSHLTSEIHIKIKELRWIVWNRH